MIRKSRETFSSCLVTKTSLSPRKGLVGIRTFPVRWVSGSARNWCIGCGLRALVGLKTSGAENGHAYHVELGGAGNC